MPACHTPAFSLSHRPIAELKQQAACTAAAHHDTAMKQFRRATKPFSVLAQIC
jgi:hypothetical protein